MAGENPCCTHSVVRYDAEKHPDGSCSERWACRDCKVKFMPVPRTDVLWAERARKAEAACLSWRARAEVAEERLKLFREAAGDLTTALHDLGRYDAAKSHGSVDDVLAAKAALYAERVDARKAMKAECDALKVRAFSAELDDLRSALSPKRHDDPVAVEALAAKDQFNWHDVAACMAIFKRETRMNVEWLGMHPDTARAFIVWEMERVGMPRRPGAPLPAPFQVSNASTDECGATVLADPEMPRRVIYLSGHDTEGREEHRRYDIVLPNAGPQESVCSLSKDDVQHLMTLDIWHDAEVQAAVKHLLAVAEHQLTKLRRDSLDGELGAIAKREAAVCAEIELLDGWLGANPLPSSHAPEQVEAPRSPVDEAWAASEAGEQVAEQADVAGVHSADGEWHLCASKR